MTVTIELRAHPKTALGEGLPTPPKVPTVGLPRLWETFGRTEWLGRETGHSGAFAMISGVFKRTLFVPVRHACSFD